MKTKEGRGYEVDQSGGREATNHRRQFPRAVMARGGRGEHRWVKGMRSRMRRGMSGRG